MLVKEIAPRITVDEKVRFGKPVVKGTRVGVATVLGHLAAGDTADSIVENYGLTKEDVLACLAYALDAVEHEHIRAVP
jgi:uncharacterized protein (DUF433 family)